MEKLTFSKSVLLEKIVSNMATHMETYREAMEGFRAEVRFELKAKLDQVRKAGADWDGDPRNGRAGLYLSIQGPEFHGDDYERVLSMLRMTDQASIALTEEQFAKYVMDEWEWKESFNISTHSYIAQ